MAIRRIEIQNFKVFKEEFICDFCGGINIIIGSNSTGKTTLLREMYNVSARSPHYFYQPQTNADLSNYTHDQISRYEHGDLNGTYDEFKVLFDDKSIVSSVYIPEKDILEHAKGLLPFIEEKQTGFSRIYKDVLIKAQDIPTIKQSEMQKHIGKTISDVINGKVIWDPSTGSFYTIRTNGDRIPFATEASGFKKLGFLGLLVACGQLEQDSILFWDEPENSLNPELMPILVDILLELQRGGVQIFIATHSELLANYFNVNSNESNMVVFYSLYRDGDYIKADKCNRFDLLMPNNLSSEPVKLYEKEIERWMGNV
jgi:AAA15 family ATPase/GTPase